MVKRKIPENNRYFTYHNVNPKDKFTGDCVVRALAYANDMTWDEVFFELCSIGINKKLMPNNEKVYEQFLKDKGWRKQKQPVHYDGTKYRAFNFCNAFARPEKRYIISMRRHLTVIANKKVVDIWDCSKEVVGVYWTRP